MRTVSSSIIYRRWRTGWRVSRTRTQSHRLVRRKDARWSLTWPSGANLRAQKQHMYFFGASVTTVCLFFFVIGRVLTRLRFSRLTPSLNQPDFWVLSPIIGFSKPDNRTQDILTKSLIQNKPDNRTGNQINLIAIRNNRGPTWCAPYLHL